MFCFLFFSPDWVPVAEIPGDETKGRVPDLVEGNQYEFRVRAVNKGGPGEPSEASKPHTARHKNCTPHSFNFYLFLFLDFLLNSHFCSGTKN